MLAVSETLAQTEARVETKVVETKVVETKVVETNPEPTESSVFATIDKFSVEDFGYSEDPTPEKLYKDIVVRLEELCDLLYMNATSKANLDQVEDQYRVDGGAPDKKKIIPLIIRVVAMISEIALFLNEYDPGVHYALVCTDLTGILNLGGCVSFGDAAEVFRKHRKNTAGYTEQFQFLEEYLGWACAVGSE
jgi:hypothetical protein